ncbi:hypothetical protein [Nocardioides ferulae]|uniref:hypothetical protein n=1 Tax=Nocardioides ferulae TaxID=2340821 RepID=UPI000EB4526D|nr:hypothetical protein [Nocardioides ferulae]
MFVISSVMVVILALSGLVLAFVAYPLRGREISSAPWLGEMLARAAESLPTVDSEADDIAAWQDQADSRAPRG